MKLNRKIILSFIYFTALCSIFVRPVYSDVEKVHLLDRYTLECFDPLHRYYNILKPAYKLWEDEWKDIYPIFFDFIAERQDDLQSKFPKLYDPNHQLVWIDEDSLPNYKVTFIPLGDDSIAVKHPLFGNLTDTKWNYILLNGEFYVGPSIKSQFHHTSLSRGESLEAAGTLLFENGKLAAITLSSGHYRPQLVHGRQALQALYAHGIDPSKIIFTWKTVENGIRVTHRLTVEEFMAMEPHQSP